MSRLWIQLGRNGDILNVLPILHLASQLTREPQKLLISAAFHRLLTGFSYIEPVLWHDDWRKLSEAIQWAKKRYTEVIPLATFGFGIPFENEYTSFQLDQWKQGHCIEHWGQIPLVVDQRDSKREAELVQKHIPDKARVILVADMGSCSPFPSKNGLLSLLQERFGQTHKIIRLSEVLAKYPYDVLGLYDRAECLVTIDTMHLHLSLASKVPVVALAVDNYGAWAASAYHPRFKFWCRYSEFEKCKEQIVEAVEKASESSSTKLVHVWSGGSSAHNTKNEAERRWDFAHSVWQKEYKNEFWIQAPFKESQFKRDARQIGEKAILPYVHDMVNCAASAVGYHGIIVLTNADTVPVSGLTEQIIENCKAKGSCFAHRWDFGRLELPITHDEMKYGAWYPGSDLFAFTKGWWLAYQHMLPDLIYGRDAWDMGFRLLVKMTGGGELKKAIYHEYHSTLTLSGQPGSNHNNKLVKEWKIKKNRKPEIFPELYSRRVSLYSKTKEQVERAKIEYVTDRIKVVLPVCQKDAALMVANLQWQGTLEDQKDFACVVSADSGVAPETIAGLEAAARRAYRDVEIFTYPTSPATGWPQGPNWAFQQTVKHMAKSGKPWFWMESDCVPLRKGWLDAWNTEYERCRKPIMGVVVRDRWHCNGTAIYPPNFAELSPKAMACTTTAWDEAMMSDTIRITHDASHLLCHVWGIVNGRAHPHEGPPPSFPDWEHVKRWIRLDAVLMHRAKDTSLIERLKEHHNHESLYLLQPDQCPK